MATQTTDQAKPGPKPGATRTRANGAGESNGAKSDGSGSISGSTGALLGAAAAGVALGVAAMIGRKVAVQAPTVLAGDWDQALAAFLNRSRGKRCGMGRNGKRQERCCKRDTQCHCC